MADTQYRSQIIEAGVKSLIDFGYPYVNEENIFTDIVYRKAFWHWLRSALEDRPDLFDIINPIMEEVK